MIVRACESYNVAFIQTVLHYCDLPMVCQLLHHDLVDMCRSAESANLLACVYDTMSTASVDLWSRLLSLDNFLLFQVASADAGRARTSEIILEGCMPEILKTMILAAKSRREFCKTFVALCEDNATELLQVYRRHFPFDLWDDMASYDGFLGPSRAAIKGHIRVLEIIREGYRRVKRESWHSLLAHLLEPKVLGQCSVGMAHYLYFEQELRPHLEHDALVWQAFRANQSESRPLLQVGSTSSFVASSATASSSDDD